MSVRVELNQIRASPEQVRVYPTPSMTAMQIDMTQVMDLMMSMMQMVLMMVLMLLPVQLLPKILSAVRV